MGEDAEQVLRTSRNRMLDYILNDLVPYILLEVLKPTFVYGLAKRSVAPGKDALQVSANAERHAVGMWKPAIEAAIYLIEDSLVVLEAASAAARRATGREEPPDSIFWDAVIKFLISINFNTTPILDTAKLYLIGHQVVAIKILPKDDGQ